MNQTALIRIGLAVAILGVLGLRSATVQSDPTFTAGTAPTLAQIPLYMRDAVPPLNMLVMGKDHKIYYEAYNDASDLNNDGILDVGYKPSLDYYGYYNSFACYNWDTGNGGRFVPVGEAPAKTCSGQWSGDFLNYLTTSRMDALRRVLYGGWRNVDTAAETVLQGAFFPQDAHSWGKEYRSIDRDGYDIRDYAPLGLPETGRYHLFAVTTVTGNANVYPNYQAPLFRVLQNSPYRVWNWLSIEGPVAGNSCFNASNQRVTCTAGGTAGPFPGHPANRAAFDALQTTFATPANRFGSGNIATIDCGANCNPYGANDNYLSIIDGTINVSDEGRYIFLSDGDNAVDFQLLRNGVVVAESGCYGAGGFGSCNGAASPETDAVVLATGNYTFRFRHEEERGGDGYRLSFRRCPGNSNCGNGSSFGVVPSTGGDLRITSATITTYNLRPGVGGSTRQDYLVRVQACPANAALRDSTCKTYPNGTSKPTGILHDYGENQRMYFGLITGSQRNNLEGGVLRRNVEDFASEVDASSGVFNNVEGVVRSIDRLRMIGGSYNNGTTNNLTSDSNWNWNGGTGNCPSIGDRAINNGECRMWGNPIAEMMYEGLRYFAGAGEPTARFATGGATQGVNEETTLGLTSATWRDPYGTSGAGMNYPACARPYQTVISDINPSYDGDLPGSGFARAITTTSATPASISGFSAAGQGQQIWDAEYGGPRSVFIGDVGGVTDGAPTAKTASSFGNIRGLSPEEPTKGGTFYSASVARFGRTTDVNAAPDSQNISTYSIALASPLPRIEFPVDGTRKVTLVPFAKTVSGTFGGGTRKPTNTIVDFYVEEFINFPGAGQPFNGSINGGRPQATFRINYEDVEQGNDHDMDAIVRYQVSAIAGGNVQVVLDSEYAAGSANQNMGYVISGTTQDGIYLEVRDRDNTNQASSAYFLNTPPGVAAGGCVGAMGTAPCNQGLGFASTRTFTPSTTAAPTIQLKNPLWYAAKYGAPDLANWDTNGDGEPDNYFLVTNPLNLRTQLSAAFDDIANRELDVGNRAVSGARVQSGSFTLAPTFARGRNGKDWTGNVSAISIYGDGRLGPSIWSAQSKLAPSAGAVPHTARNIRTITAPGAGTRATRTAATFQEASLGATNADRLSALGITEANVASVYGASYTAADFVAYLRGNQAREAFAGGPANTLRTRSSVLGDIVNSEPVVASGRSDFGYGAYADPMFAGYANTGSSGYLFDKRNRKTVVYVGANDGMLHAFDASTVNCAPDGQGRVISCGTAASGEELFGFIPNGVLHELGKLAVPDNNYDHRYYVDGQVTVADAKDGGAWKTLLVGSTGAGGKSVFALDVTNIESRLSFSDNQVLWERNNAVDRDIGHVYGKPLLVPLENSQWGVLFGNGYGGNLSDPSLYILDAFTGAVIKKITANDGAPAGTTTNPIVNWICNTLGILCARTVDPFNGLGQITAIDRDGNGKVDTVYGGDLQGNLWKFDLRGNSVAGWDVYDFPSGAGKVPLFTGATGTERQPITGGIRVASGPGTGVMVYFGTGRYFVNGDNDVPTAPQVQSLYAVFDNAPITGNTGSSPAGTRANLVGQTVTAQNVSPDGQFTTRDISRNAVSYYGTGARRGWYLDLKVETALNGNGERFIATPRIQSGRVFFTTYAPTEDGCTPGGTNFQYGLDLLSGAGALSNVQVLPSGTPACTGANCGGAAVRADGSTTQPPITNTGILSISPVSSIETPGVCGGPGLPACPTFEECQVVIYPGAFVLPRPCGRQSWRQLK